ncbi:MAG: FAD-dependent monooxygenase, partial [Ilumatobacteraceae bacterium]
MTGEPNDAADGTVLVVGGGPVGVAAAIACANRGFAVTVVEKATEIYDLPRAIVMDDEVQRALTLIGAGDGLAGVTSALPGAEFVDIAGERIIGFELPDGTVSGLGYPPVVRYYQPDLESFLRMHASAAGVRFLLGEEVISVAATETDVRATLASGSVLSADWLIAADGAASPIRKSLGIRFDSLGFDQEWMVVDVRLLDGREPELPLLVQQHCDPERPSTFVPGHDRYRRWEFQLQDGETREAMTEPARVWELLSPWLTPDDATIVRAAVYRFHGTVAS